MKRILSVLLLPVLFISSINAQFDRIHPDKKYEAVPQLQGLVTDVKCLFRTQTQGGWGASPHGNNPGSYLTANFAAAFPGGLVLGCSGGFTLTLTTARAVTDFLPSGGRPSALTQNLVDPVTYSNTLGGQVAALALSVGFDLFYPDFGASSSSLGDQTIANGIFGGWTVKQVLQEGNDVLGGCSTTHTAAEMTDALASINESYDDGVQHTSVFVCSCDELYVAFSADTVCLGASTVITNLSSGVDDNAVYSLDLFNDGTIDFTSVASALPHDTIILIPFAGTIDYYVTVVNSNGCSASFAGTIVVFPADPDCLQEWGEKKGATVLEPETETRFNILCNPSSNETTIIFSVAEETNALIEVFNMDGIRVATLFDGKVKDTVINSIPFSSSNYQPGIYLCRMQSSNGINLVKKAVVMER